MNLDRNDGVEEGGDRNERRAWTPVPRRGKRNELGVRCSHGDAINIALVIKRLSSNERWGCGGGFGGCTLDLVQPTRRVNRPLFLLHPHFQKGQGVFSA